MQEFLREKKFPHRVYWAVEKRESKVEPGSGRGGTGSQL